MNWDNCPPNLQEIYLDYNKITEMNWKIFSSNLQTINLSANEITNMNWKNCPPNLQIYPKSLHTQFQEYKKTLPFYKEMSKKLRPITNSILHFHMQPPKNDAGTNTLQQHGGILFHEDALALKEVLKGFL